MDTSQPRPVSAEEAFDAFGCTKATKWCEYVGVGGGGGGDGDDDDDKDDIDSESNRRLPLPLVAALGPCVARMDSRRTPAPSTKGPSLETVIAQAMRRMPPNGARGGGGGSCRDTRGRTVSVSVAAGEAPRRFNPPPSATAAAAAAAAAAANRRCCPTSRCPRTPPRRPRPSLVSTCQTGRRRAGRARSRLRRARRPRCARGATAAHSSSRWAAGAMAVIIRMRRRHVGGVRHAHVAACMARFGVLHLRALGMGRFGPRPSPHQGRRPPSRRVQRPRRRRQGAARGGGASRSTRRTTAGTVVLFFYSQEPAHFDFFGDM